MEYVNMLLKYLGKVLSSAFFQIMAVFGFFFIFGILLYFISRSTRGTFANSGNQKLDIYFTGWIGTPVHELGHAFFCLVFGHRIENIKLFSPNSTDGSLGYVNHSYNPDSFYQNVGKFFIGLGPIIFGSFILYALMYFMLPNFNEITLILSSSKIQNTGFFDLMRNFGSLFQYGLKILATIFTFSNFGSLLFWLFLYLSFSISSHMQLSPPDLKGMFEGLGTIIGIFLLINMVTVLLKFDLTGYILKYSHFTGILFGIFLFSLFISLINFILTYIIITTIHFIKYRRLVSII
jgi:hypothetical protein